MEALVVPFNRNQVKLGVSVAAILLAAAGTFIARTAFARIAYNTIDPIGSVAGNGRQITVTGPIASDAGERTELRVMVTQRSTGAVAEGRAFLVGTGAMQQWQVGASAQGNEDFAPGPATAVAMARTSVRGQATDAHQWLVNITLVGE